MYSVTYCLQQGLVTDVYLWGGSVPLHLLVMASALQHRLCDYL